LLGSATKEKTDGVFPSFAIVTLHQSQLTRRIDSLEEKSNEMGVLFNASWGAWSTRPIRKENWQKNMGNTRYRVKQRLGRFRVKQRLGFVCLKKIYAAVSVYDIYLLKLVKRESTYPISMYCTSAT